MGENNSNGNNWQRVNIQNIQAAHTTQYQENKGRTLDDINQSKILYDPPPKVIEIKTKVNKWDRIKLKSFCTAKGIINKKKRQSSDREKRYANDSRA